MWELLCSGVFEAATIHYAVAKIFGPLLFGRGWCGYACWTAMVLDFLPYKKPQAARKSSTTKENENANVIYRMKPMSYFSVVRVKCDKEKCISCGKCKKVCPMNVDIIDNSRKRKNGTECILCMECVKTCPRKAL